MRSSPLPSPEKLAELWAAAFLTLNPPADSFDWAIIEAAVDLIAAHYGLDAGEVWSEVIRLEIEIGEETGLVNFGHALECPAGFASLGLSVAQALLPAGEADTHPLIYLGYH